MADYVGNVISWNRQLALDACERIEATAGLPWHVAFARARTVSEYLAYGLFVDRVVGPETAGVWIDERSWCHTYWGPGPLSPLQVEGFVAQLAEDDVAFSIAGYTTTEPEVAQRATKLALQRAGAC
jgi:hypothetical protein